MRRVKPVIPGSFPVFPAWQGGGVIEAGARACAWHNACSVLISPAWHFVYGTHAIVFWAMRFGGISPVLVSADHGGKTHLQNKARNMVHFMNARQAAELVVDGDTLAVSSFIGNALPEVVLKAVSGRFAETGHPKGLTVVHVAGCGTGDEGGLNHMAREGLLKRVIAGHWNMTRQVGRLAMEEKIEAYNLPQGVLSHLFRDIAAGRVGTLTHVGLLTFVDPRLDGGKINASAKEDLVALVHVAGRELLLYKSFPVNVAILRGTYADERGNVTLQREGATLEVQAMAQAAKNSGGKVIVQVDAVVQAGSLDPRLVLIPGIYVDAIVQAEGDDLRQATREQKAWFCGDARVPASAFAPMPLDERKIIARRAAMELRSDIVVNLGIGMPEGVAQVANEEGIGGYMTMIVEAGPVGGIPQGGLLFGMAANPEAILQQNAQFDFFDGGGIDLAFLGLAEMDAEGNINVSKLGSRVTGAGGFINITQNAKRLVYCGTFTAKGLKIRTGDGALEIVNEGAQRKFKEKVGHVTFSGNYARKVKQPVLYITERAVFALREDGVHLVEIAPGADLEKDILALMDFVPIMKTPPALMDARIFTDEPMGLAR
jgi:propionate CoA-transferase